MGHLEQRVEKLEKEVAALRQQVNELIGVVDNSSVSDENSTNDNADLISVKEFQRMLDISQPKAYEIIHSKGFPMTKIGRNYRVNKTKVLAMIEAGHKF